MTLFYTPAVNKLYYSYYLTTWWYPINMVATHVQYMQFKNSNISMSEKYYSCEASYVYLMYAHELANY